MKAKIEIPAGWRKLRPTEAVDYGDMKEYPGLIIFVGVRLDEIGFKVANRLIIRFKRKTKK